MNETFELYRDEDGHWYVIPSSKHKETEEYFNKVYKYWENMPDEDEPIEPDWLISVGGCYNLVKFESYTIE